MLRKESSGQHRVGQLEGLGSYGEAAAYCGPARRRGSLEGVRGYRPTGVQRQENDAYLREAQSYGRSL